MATSAKVVLVTGCSSGIGLATAILLAKDENQRFYVYATVRNKRNAEDLETAAKDLLGKTLFIKELDVTSVALINEVVDDIISERGRIDVLVNNAGIGLFGALETMPVEKIKAVLATNVYGPINLTKKVIETWKKDTFGHIVMISCVAGLIGIPFNSVYSASKFALEGFTEAIVSEYKDKNLRVSIIEPGPVKTNFIESVTENSSQLCQLTNIDQETKETMNLFIDKSNARIITMGQTPEHIAEYVFRAVTGSYQQLRYQTNKVYSTAIEQKLNDRTGGNSYDIIQKYI